jgi:hypothetical protein
VRRHLRFRLLAGALLAGVGGWYAGVAAAQTAATIHLTKPSTETFPQISFFASVIGPDGGRIHALPPTSFTLTEDGVAIADFSMEEDIVGARQIYAVNTLAPLRRRDALGVTRFEQVRSALLDAWQARPASTAPDQVTLITAEETLGVNLPAAAGLLRPLQDWQVTYGSSEAGYAVLLNALTSALDPRPNPGMESDVVFITPLLDRSNEQALADAVALATTSGTRIHGVLVGTLEQAGVAEALRLRQAAGRTGGSFEVFDPSLGFEALESRLQDVRTRYAVEYTSPANATGPHSIQLAVTTPDLTASSEPIAFTVAVEPPQMTFIQAPARIVRETDDSDTPLADIPPTFIDLPLLVTFPDDHPRPLTRLQLFINGELHETRVEPPFDRVRWDLSSISESRGFLVRAEVVDSQGLVASTEIAPISIEVIPGPRGLEALRPALAPLFGGLAIVAIGAALAVAWVQLGEVLPEAGWAAPTAGGMRLLRRVSLGTLTPPSTAEAYLVPLNPDGSPGTPVVLDGSELTIGSDASLCGLLLDDPSVSGIHAHLTRLAAGAFTLRDQHSVAGTWVNETSVGEGGRQLRHGDRIYFGRAAYRFRMATPGPETRVVVRPAAEASSVPFQ